MKKLMIWMVVLSVGMFSIGCGDGAAKKKGGDAAKKPAPTKDAGGEKAKEK
jgi:hypothetical protein